MRKVTISLLVLSSFLFLFSCKEKKEKVKVDRETLLSINPRIDNSMKRDHEDSTKVLELAKNYLDLLKQHSYSDAINLLVDVNEHKDSIFPLSSKRKEELMRINERFQFVSYNIDEIFFYSDMDTEVRYTITLYEKTSKDDNRPNTMQCALFPRRVNNKWYLTVKEQRQERD